MDQLSQILARLENIREDNREFRAETRAEVTALRLDIKTLSDKFHRSEMEFSEARGKAYGAAAVIAFIVSAISAFVGQIFFRGP